MLAAKMLQTDFLIKNSVQKAKICSKNWNDKLL